MPELIEALGGDRELDSIAGLSFRRDGEAVHNPLRERCADLDSLRFPTSPCWSATRRSTTCRS